MKTVFIDCSPKRKFSASGFVASMTSVFVPGIKKKMKLRTKADHEAILTELTDADAVVFSMPLYVDGVPSHILPFLKEMEQWCRGGNHAINVYVIANNGFIEGRQNEPLMQVMENRRRSYDERDADHDRCISWNNGIETGHYRNKYGKFHGNELHIRIS